jgi:hypothetical protein
MNYLLIMQNFKIILLQKMCLFLEYEQKINDSFHTEKI